MGVFTVSCEVQSVRPGGDALVVDGLLVDSGSELTWLPAPVLAQAGVTITKRDQPFCMANGQTITRCIGYALLRAAGFETVDEVVFGEPGDLSLLGARTLEGFGAVVDARRKRLVAAGPHLVAGVGISHGRSASVHRERSPMSAAIGSHRDAIL